MTEEIRPEDTAIYPVLPLRDIVVFPHLIAPLFVGREKSVSALEEVMKNSREILLVTQKDATKDEPAPEDIYSVGVIASVLQLLKLPDGTVKVLVEGKRRAHIDRYIPNDAFFEAEATVIDETVGDEKTVRALSRTITGEFEKYLKLNKNIPQEALVAAGKIDEPSKLADTIAHHLAIKIDEKQELLEITAAAERLEKIYSLMQGEISVLNVEKKIKSRVKRQMEKTQREYYLNEQMKAIQKELGESEDGKDELGELEARIEDAKLSKEAYEKAQAEMKKLRNMSPMSAEATVVRNYLDWLVSIPWKKKARVKKDLKAAEVILDSDHYGLDKVKERIVEYLAVQQRKSKLKGPILCLVGPPGVGKTSLGKSIAKATNREFIRISLGGVRDEAEIRGHRRTYIGSMPGKIIQSMKKAKTTNPLILLDEIDKMGQANTMNLPRPLLDRMEIIRLEGYTEEEKVEIAKRHLLDDQREAHGLSEKEFSIDDEALSELVRTYTREAGVRNLKREIAKLARKAVTKIVRDDTKRVDVTVDKLDDMLGAKKFRYGLAEEKDAVGAVTGLAWTEVGGDLLHIEAVRMPGRGRMKTTGTLGDVMKESIDAASSYVRSIAPTIGVKPPDFERMDIHVHVPEGATPKDGPSAGIGMVTSFVSILTGIAIRKDVAMTGEVTLRGNVLPIGGLKEKLLAALRGGITTVVIPKENEKDLREVPDSVKKGLQIILSTRFECIKGRTATYACFWGR